jgi:glycyl-tRNA synthetase beta chain
MSEFLFEIGLEEVPARMIASAQAELAKRIDDLFLNSRLYEGGAHTPVKSFATPRRLAVYVPDVRLRQPDTTLELLGPSVKVAFKDGVPTSAAEAFARKSGIAVSDLKVVATAKGEYLGATVLRAGVRAAEVIVEELPKLLSGVYWAKNMYWRLGKPERFVRPVRWLLCLLGGEVVPVSFGGKTAKDATYGHRVLHGDAPISIAKPADYEQALLGGFVIADVEARRHKIRKALDRACRTIPAGSPGHRWREDHALVDKLTHLTEWPTVIAGGFEPEYLALPEEVLVTVMRDHQSYFAVESDSKLAAHFLAVLNTETDAAGEAVIRHGNERVLRARFNDARFFWEFDQRVPLLERVGLLEKVTFQKDMGSYAAKTERVRAAAARLGALVGSRGGEVDGVALDEAALLAKTDLTCELVKEFTELQGEVGGLYARAQGYRAAVGDAIYDQYRPVSMEDRVPRTREGALLALADKADTIAGMFGLGLEPTGSKDPFALRRAANGVVKILAEAEPALPLTLGDVADAASAREAVRLRVEVFFAERLEFYLREAKGQAYDVVKAVLAAGANDVRDAVARAEAVTAVRGSEDFVAVCAAFKRMKNILAQAEERGDPIVSCEPSFDTQHEREFWREVQSSGAGFRADCESQDYAGALAKLAKLRPLIDNYFAETMVMAEDLNVRANRLGMLGYLATTFTRIADFSEIVVAG